MNQASRALRRTATVLVVLLTTATAAAFPASAAPPRNDSIATPTVVRSIPSTFVQDTSEATASASDGPCVNGASVWYRFRPTTTASTRVVTIGSDYDTVLAVFRGSRTNRTLVACNDDAAGLASATRHRFTAGRTYWIAVSACCNRAASGGHTVLTLYPNRRNSVTTTITSAETGGISGALFVSGTVRCATPSVAYVEVLASQRVGANVARGYGFEAVQGCTSAGTPFRVWTDSETGWAFQPGTAAVQSFTSAEDGFSAIQGQAQTTYVPVVLNPSLRHVQPHQRSIPHK